MKLMMLIALLAILIGFFSGGALESTQEGKTLTADFAKASGRIPHRTSNQTGWQRDMAINDSTERWLRLVARLEQAGVEDMQAIAESIGTADQRLTRMVMLRWFELDPGHCFAASLAEIERTRNNGPPSFVCYDFLEHLAENWLEHDYEAALAAFTAANPKVIASSFTSEVFVARLIGYDVLEAAELATKWGVEFDLDDAAIAKLKERDPKAVIKDLFKSFQTLQKGESQSFNGTGFFYTLGTAWTSEELEEALSTVMALDLSSDWGYEEILFKRWAEKDHEAAAIWLDRQEESFQDLHRAILIQQWASDDAEAALAWCNEHLANHPRYQRTMERLMVGAIEGDLEIAHQITMSLDDKKTQKYALKNIASKHFWRLSRGDKETLPESIAWLNRLENTAHLDSAIEGATSPWLRHDPQSMKEFFAQRESDISSERFSPLLRSMGASDPEGALDWSASLGDRAPLFSGIVYDQWLRRRPEAALNWFQNNPTDGEIRQAILDKIRNARGNIPGLTEIINLEKH